MTVTYRDLRAHAVRERDLGLIGGEGVPVPVEPISEDPRSLRIEVRWGTDLSWLLQPGERRVALDVLKAPLDQAPFAAEGS